MPLVSDAPAAVSAAAHQIKASTGGLPRRVRTCFDGWRWTGRTSVGPPPPRRADRSLRHPRLTVRMSMAPPEGSDLHLADACCPVDELSAVSCGAALHAAGRTFASAAKPTKPRRWSPCGVSRRSARGADRADDGPSRSAPTRATTTSICAAGSGPGTASRASPAGASSPLNGWAATVGPWSERVAWPAGCRRLHRRYERKAEHFLTFAEIAAALICFRRLSACVRQRAPATARSRQR